MKEITITIRPDGTVEFETHGITGKTCVEISEIFEKSLTGQTGQAPDVQRELKSEYYQSQSQSDANVQDRSS